MINIDMYEVNETCNVIEREELGVCTIALSISLPECMDNNFGTLNERAYEKITTLVKNLVSTGQYTRADFDTSIVSKRIPVTPIALVGGFARKYPEGFVTVAKTLDMTAEEVGVNLTGGYLTLMSRGVTEADKNLILSVPQTLPQTERVRSSVNVGSTKTGIGTDTVEFMDRIVTRTAEATRGRDSLDYAKLVTFYNALNDSPFMTGTFHSATESETTINVSVDGPGVVKAVLAGVRDVSSEVLCETIKKTAFKIAHMGQLMAQEASRRMGIPFGIINLSLALIPSVGDSVAKILEEIGLECADAPGTAAALAMLNNQVREGGVVAFSYMSDLNNAFIPVSEDQGMIGAVSVGALIVEKLEAMTCVCSVGLDIIATPGDTLSSAIAGIITDEAAIGAVDQKMTAVRLIPVMGKKVGETAELGGLLGCTPVMPVSTFSYGRFITRGEGVPAPIHSFKS